MHRVKNKAIVVSLIFSLLLMCFSAFAASFSATSTDVVKIRTKPSTKSAEMGRVQKGQKVTVTSTVKKGQKYSGVTADLDFYQLKSGGFVAAQYIKKADTTTANEPSSNDISEEDIQDEDIQDDDIVDIDSSSSEVEDVYVGEVGYDDDDDDLVGVNETDDDDSDDNTDENIEEDVSVETGSGDVVFAKKVKATSAVYIRQEPSKESESLDVVKKDSVITVVNEFAQGDSYNDIEVEDTWYQVNTGGYVMAQYFEEVKEKDATSTIKKVTTSTRMATAKSDIKMFSKPIELSTSKGTLKKGKSMEISSTIKSGTNVQGTKAVGTWYKLSNGAYVKSSDVNVSTKTSTKEQRVDAKPASNLPIAVQDGVTAIENVRIRSTPSTAGSVLGLFTTEDYALVVEIVQSGSTYEGAKVSGKWYKLDKGGFVSADYVKFSEKATIELSTVEE